MLIRKIKVCNFKRLIGPVIIDGLGEGINIIAGNNEEGKSTLLQAVKALILSRHGSKTQEIKNFKPYNGAARPELAFDFELGGKKYSLQKAFLSNPLAEFRSPEGVYVGAEAEDKIRELFGLGGLGKAGKKAADSDPGVLGLLWLEQGVGERGLQTNEGGREILMQALENDLSAVVGGQRGRRLQKEIATQYAAYFGINDKEKVTITRERDELNKLGEKLAGYQSSYESYKKKLDSLLDAQEKLSEYEKNGAEAKLKLQIKELDDQINKIEKLKPAVNAARQTEFISKTELDKLEKQAERRQKLLAEIAADEESVEQTRKEVLSLQLLHTDLSEKLKSAEFAVAAAEKHMLDSESLYKTSRLRLSFDESCREKNRLEGEIKHLEQLQEKIEEKAKELLNFKVDRQSYAKLENLHRDLLTAETRANAAATRLRIKPNGDGQAFLDGVKVLPAEDLLVYKSAVLKIENWGEIEIVPGGDNNEDHAAELSSVRQKLDAALATVGAVSLQEAAESLALRNALDGELMGTRAELERAGGAKQIAVLKDLLKNLNEKIAAFEPAEDIEVDADKLATLQEEADKAKSAYDASCACAKKISDELVRNELAKTGRDKDLQHICVMLDAKKNELMELGPKSEDEQAKEIEFARSKWENDRLAFAALVQELNSLDEKGLNEKLTLSRKEQENLHKTISNLNVQKLTLSTEIKVTGQSGLGELMEKCAGEYELAKEDFERLYTNASALKLLHETLAEAEKEGKSQLMQPVVDIVSPLLKTLIPGAALVMDEAKIEISNLVRDGIKEDYADLSVGTREQISVLTRLGIGHLLRRKGLPAALILDDALVYSDPERFAKMKEILAEAAAELQILILTCRQGDYTDIGKSNVFRLNA